MSCSGTVRDGIQRDLKRRTETPATALGFDRAFVQIDKMLGNCNTKTEPTKLTGHGRISLFEWRKQRGQPRGFNSNPVVANLEMEIAFIAKGSDGDLSTWRRELDGVVNQIPKHLLKPDAISHDLMLLCLESGRQL